MKPAPQIASRDTGPLLFVIQKRSGRQPHYVLRLELDGVLKSWALAKGPSLAPADKRAALEVVDQHFDDAAYEGVMPAGGHVIVWDCGVYSPDDEQQYSFDDRAQALARVRQGLGDGKLSLFLRGERLKGSFALVRTRSPKQWMLIKHKDRFAGGNELLADSRSMLSGITLQDMSAALSPPPTKSPGSTTTRLIACGPAERLPARLSPMLADSAERPHSDPEWLYEPKLDGYRVIAFVQDAAVRLRSRRGLDLTSAFPEIIEDLAAFANARMVLDGEVVALDRDGRPSFNALQNRVQLKTRGEIERARRTTPVVLVCFDLLHFAGLNLRTASYVERRRYLSQCLLPSSHIQLMHAVADAEQLYAAASANGFEGIVGKRKDSIYQAGKRSNAWRKYKSTHTEEFVVGGYTQGKGERTALGALLLGRWSDGALRYVGHVGSGLSSQLLDEIGERIRPLGRERSPFDAKVQLHRPTRWLEPQLVAEVSFAEWTPDGLLRAPVFIRLREDVKSRHVVARNQANKARKRAVHRAATPANEIEQILQQLDRTVTRLDLSVAGTRIRLTSLDRVYWPARPARQPAVTKRHLLRYLAQVSHLMLPHLHARPLTMIRMPEGINGERFFQKHWEQALPDFVETVNVYSDHKDEQHRYLLANNLPTLLWLGQNGTLEFHVWHSRAQPGADSLSQSTDYSSSLAALKDSVLNYPDYLIFDIDPYIYSGRETTGAEPELNPRGFAVGKRVAFWLRALLQQMSLDAIVKTSGKTGLHIFVPIDRTVTFDAARHICESVGRHLMHDHPKQITLDWAIEKRSDRIFIDYNMNVRGKTLNVAYSPRGVPGAPVSMPLSWEELQAAEVMDFTIASAPARLESSGDRWQDALANKYSLSRALDREADKVGQSK